MQLRTYLVKRAIHTVITLIVVLVLLFVLFRLMPGDPTRFFQRPNQTQADRDQILVDFGFSKWVPAPGNGYRVTFNTDPVGVYQANVTINSTGSDSLVLYVAHARFPSDPSRYRVIGANVSEAGVRQIWNYTPGDELTLHAQFQRPPSLAGWVNVTANATVSSRFTPDTAMLSLGAATLDAEGNHDFIQTFDTDGFDLGVYKVRIDVVDVDNSANNYSVDTAFELNRRDISPFAFPEDELHLNLSASKIQGTVTVNITHPDGILRPHMEVVLPSGKVDRSLPPMAHPNIAVRNNPLEEFVVYMRNMLLLDFGDSFYTRQPVWDEIAKRVGPTMLLFGSALVIGALVGIALGAVMAWRRGSRLELGTIVVSLFFNSMPVFWLGLVLIWFFAHSLNWFPIAGWSDYNPTTYCNPKSGECVGSLGYVKDVLWHMVLPLSNLLILGLAGSILLMRNSMLEVLGEDYIMTARAKGLSERAIMYRHAARNAMLPVVTSIALSVGGVISGGVLTETIFTWPGMGLYLIQSTLSQDFPAVQGAFYLLALITIFSNMVADVMYAFLDPRVRL